MTRAEALRALVSKPREVPDDGRIGHTVKFAEPDDAKIRIPRGWQRRLADWKRRHVA
jgi:hypothetical protein